MKLADISIKRPVFATVMVSVLAVFGVWGYRQLSIDMFPDVEFPICTVTATYPGADPETIESRVVDKLEEAISAVSGIKTLRSTSMESVGLVFVQFELERKADQAVQDVRDKVSAALKNLPSDLEPPLVERLDIGAAPVMAIALAGDMPKRDLTDIAKNTVKQRLQAINGVGTVDIIGGQEREFHVWIDPQRLDSFGLAPGDVAQAVASQNVEIPGGRLDSGALELSIKTRGQVHSAEELGNIIITAAGGAPVRIRDVARVEDGEQERRSYATFSGKSSVTMVVRKQSGSNTVDVAHKVKAALEKLKPQFPNVTMRIASDNSVFTERAIGDVKFDLLFGAALAILIIMFFLHDWRATLISATALPVSVISTFAFIYFMGYTLNMMTMLALSLSIGILIDDAIVVIENIHRHLEMGKSPMKAASEATAEIGLAVMATTASILAVFVPVATMKGMIGRFFVQFGLTVAFAVAVSLFVAFTLTPMLSSRFLRAHTGKGPIGKAIEGFLDAIEHAYSRLLTAALRHRVLTVLSAIAVFVGSIFLAAIVPKEFMSVEDRSQFMVKLEMPSGASLGATETMSESIATKLRAVPGVQDTLVTIGGSALAEINRAEIQVNLVGKKKRNFSQAQMIAYTRNQIRWLAGPRRRELRGRALQHDWREQRRHSKLHGAIQRSRQEVRGDQQGHRRDHQVAWRTKGRCRRQDANGVRRPRHLLPRRQARAGHQHRPRSRRRPGRSHGGHRHDHAQPDGRRQGVGNDGRRTTLRHPHEARREFQEERPRSHGAQGSFDDGPAGEPVQRRFDCGRSRSRQDRAPEPSAPDHRLRQPEWHCARRGHQAGRGASPRRWCRPP